MYLAAVVLSLVVAGCGGDDEPPPAKEPPARGETTGNGPTASAPSATRPPPDAAPPGGTEHRRENPESQPGGAGDEEAARSPAMFTGRGGKITPREVRVPPFLAVRVELRSADGRRYAIRFGERGAVRSGGTLDLPGLRPQERVKGTGGVSIFADAEPGP